MMIIMKMKKSKIHKKYVIKWYSKNAQNVLFEKKFFGKLVLTCDDEMLPTTENSLDDKTIICDRNYFLNHT